MATETLPIKKRESIFDEMEKVRDRIMWRAYEIFEGTGRSFGKDLDDWLQAERELLWTPAIELREEDDEFFINVATPGMEAKALEIEVTPEEVLVKWETHHDHKEEKGRVHTCEFRSGSLFRTIHLPKKIDPDKVSRRVQEWHAALESADRRRAAKQESEDRSRVATQQGKAKRVSLRRLALFSP